MNSRICFIILVSFSIQHIVYSNAIGNDAKDAPVAKPDETKITSGTVTKESISSANNGSSDPSLQPAEKNSTDASGNPPPTVKPTVVPSPTTVVPNLPDGPNSTITTTTTLPTTTTSSTTAKPDNHTTTAAPTPTPKPTTPSIPPPKPTTTTLSPPTPSPPTSTSTLKPTTSSSSSTTQTSPTADPGPVPSKDRQFDGPSFFGGIVLTIGISAISFVAFKFYKARTERNYHTL